MKHVFLMDPLNGLHYDKDTTVALIHAVLDRGHDAYYLAKDGLSLEAKGLTLSVQKLSKKADSLRFSIGDTQPESAELFDILYIRTDPPFDAGYLHHTWLLDQAPANLTVLNSPHGIRTVNEKIWAFQFQRWIPDTLITQQTSQVEAFLARHDTIIMKPTDLFGGQGIFKLSQSDSNAMVAFEAISQGGSKAVICQAYIPEAKDGDKRILLVDGEPIGAVLRRNDGPDHRNNVFAGGICHPADITDSDLELIAELRPKLTELGLFFVGIDLLGDRLIEVNVTSPTCLVEMSQFAGTSLATTVIEAAIKTHQR